MMVVDSEGVVISIIIATHNRRHYLSQCLESVEEQALTARIEIIVVDDCSSDDTWPWLQRRLHAGATIRSFRLETPAERSAARNYGAARASGEWLLFLDDDDLLCGNALATLLAAAERHPEVIAVTGTYESFGDNHTGRNEWWPRREVVLDMLLPCVSEPIVSVNRSLLSARAFTAVGGFNVLISQHEDYAFSLRFTARGHVAIVPQTVMRHRIHGAQTQLHAGDTRRPILDAACEDLPDLAARRVRARWRTLRLEAEAANLLPRQRIRAVVETAAWIIRHDRGVAKSPFSRHHVLGGLARLFLTGLVNREFALR